MMHSKPVDSIDELSELKHLYMQLTTGPLDGMWLCGFVPMARHYGFYDGSELGGFYCVNNDGYLLQFFVDSRYRSQSRSLFDSTTRNEASGASAVKGAFVSTAEPHYLSLCLDLYSAFAVNALMYQHDERSESGAARARTLPMQTVRSAQLPEAIDFAVAAIGAPEEWLSGYYAGLIERGELSGLWEAGELIATGERRGYDRFQTEYADLGVIVAEAERGKGLATQILKDLVTLNQRAGLRSICSTETANTAAQKAISRAGFFACNRIVRFDA